MIINVYFSLRRRFRAISTRLPLVERATQMFLILAYLALGIVMAWLGMSKPCESEEMVAAFNASSGAECTEKLTFIDALYFAMVTISTVGYGDLSPSSTSMRVFMVAYCL